MSFRSIPCDDTISLFVKDIQIFEETCADKTTVLPFFSDGYPGLVFHDTPNGQYVSPHNKLMPPLYLYGLALKPVELGMRGSYRMIVFLFYPFVLKRFFGVDPKTLNDECHDLGAQFPGAAKQLLQLNEAEEQVKAISTLLTKTFREKIALLDMQVRQAIVIILEGKGLVNIKSIADRLCLTSRTFERRFTAEVGVSPKQFAQIIRFQLSLEQMTVKDHKTLSDIVYTNGFADQSHFIRVFKTFTGTTPKQFQLDRS